ncbi:MAG: transposase [Pedosphaera sp.]|nr:transposase [Pedosphaera sp.]
MTVSDQKWIQEELSTVDLGDQRLNQRMGLVLDELSQHPEASVCAATSGHNEMVGAYRFFNHPDIDERQVLAPHRDATLQRMKQQSRVLLIQDTTQLDFSGREPIKGAGYLDGEFSQGFFLHPLLAVTEQRLCLGTLWGKIYARPERGVRGTRRRRAIADKESVRWLEGYRQACAVARQLPQTQIICVQDAESDIYEVVAAAESAAAGAVRAEYVIRAAQDRRTTAEEGRLWAAMAASPVLGQKSFDLPRRPGRPARKVTADLHAQALTLRPPHRPREQQLPELKLWAVLARETEPPAGAEAVEWLLLTSVPVPDLAAALQVLHWYACRWEIEIFFKVFKAGCRVERLQFIEDTRLRPAFALYLIVAWRILYLTRLGRATPPLSCAAVLAESEWKSVWAVTQRTPVPATPPTLPVLIRLIAKLGGYKGRKGDGDPGPQTMWQGLMRVFDLALGWNTLGPGATHDYG